MQNATFDENPHENQRIRVILGCVISSIACAKHGCTGGWLILCCQHRQGNEHCMALTVPGLCSASSVRPQWVKTGKHHVPGIILCMHPANERQRYTVTLPLIGWVHSQNVPCVHTDMSDSLRSDADVMMETISHRLSKKFGRVHESVLRLNIWSIKIPSTWFQTHTGTKTKLHFIQ